MNSFLNRYIYSRPEFKWSLIPNVKLVRSSRYKFTDAKENVRITPELLESARKKRVKDLGPYVSKIPAKLIPYAELMRLEKPTGLFLLYLPCTWAIIIAATKTLAPLTSTLYMLGLFGLGSVVMRGAGCTINDLCDRDLDKKVIRSVDRPLPGNRITPTKAVAFLFVQTGTGIWILSQLFDKCWWLGLASLPLVFTYPLFKRFTYYPQIMLSSCFSWGALLGFPAMGIVDFPSMISLYASSFLWCMTYDTIYAHQDKKFDVSAGIKSTALKWGDKTKKIINMIFVAQICTLALVGFNGGILWNPGFFLGSSILGYRLFNMIKKVDLDNPEDCYRWFKKNINYGFYLTCGLFFDYLLKLLGFL